jgi:hypothetical protein
MRFGWAVSLLFVPLSLFGQAKVDFIADVQPILKKRCEGCHGAAQQMSGVRFDQRDAALAGGYSGPVILPGKSAESKLIQRVSGTKGMMVMPPSGPRLTAEEIGVLRAWIDSGAAWSGATVADGSPAKARNPHWAFQPIASPQPPSVSNSAWVRNPVDNFVLSRLDKEHIAPSPEADKRTLYRRVSLDLIGLQPTPEEMRAFLSDKRPDAYEKAVDRLLSSPHFGERIARPWLDRARYADSDGYEKDWVRPFAWRYRQWVIDAFNSDMPFDQFTIKQVAGDLLPNASIDDRIATGFHRNTLTNREGGIDNNQFRFEAAIDRANTIAATWMGLTMGCAQCHDHKYDPISQKDYYQFFAFVDKINEADIDAPLPGEIGPYIKSRDEYRDKRQALLDQYKVPQLQADWERQMLEAAANPGKRTDWDLAWDCLLKLTEGGDDGEKIMRIPLEKRTERERDILTNHFVRNYHFAVGHKVYKELKLDELDKKLKELYESYPQLSRAMTVTDSQSAPPSHLRVRGDYRTLGIEVKPNTPTVLPPMTATSGAANRLDLAKWLVSPENPLTARVTVNWIWQEFFGRGIVKTTDDFGTRGEKPSHPELLDWLAFKFVEDGWSVKQLVRNIVTSETYRQSSKVRPELQSKDPDNSLLARQTRVRLPAELIRDEALHASGLLSLKVGGKSVKPPQPSGVASLAYGAKGDDSWTESKGEDRYRRGLYIHFQRATPYPLLMNFDAPKAVVAQCKREQSNTALQALNLLNDPVFVEAATALAYRVISEAPDAKARLGSMFEYALNRPPTPGELDKFRTSIPRLQAMYEADKEAAKQLAPAELPGITRAETAALVNAATVLLNVDEFITRE